MSESTTMCKECNKRQVFIKKRELCEPCYQRLRKEGKFHIPQFDRKIRSSQTQNKIRHVAEIEFVRTYENPEDLVYQPCLFNLNGTSYKPDFCDSKKGIFYEIIGSRQRWHQIKQQLKSFRKYYPHEKLKIIFLKNEDKGTHVGKYSYGTEINLEDLEI